MQIPQFAETYHPLIQELAQHSDLELLMLLQRHPSQGRYFVALFCRYSALVYPLTWHLSASEIQGNYLFATVWRYLHSVLPTLGLEHLDPHQRGESSLRGWLLKATADWINYLDVPASEAIAYRLTEVSPPLWCFVHTALQQLSPQLRTWMLLKQTFGWDEFQVMAHAQQREPTLTLEAVKAGLHEGYGQLEALIPSDIRRIYWETESPRDSGVQSLSHPPKLEGQSRESGDVGAENLGMIEGQDG